MRSADAPTWKTTKGVQRPKSVTVPRTMTDDGLQYVITMLRMSALDSDRASEGAQGLVSEDPRITRSDVADGAAYLYREWADDLERGATFEDLPPLGRLAVALIQESRP